MPILLPKDLNIDLPEMIKVRQNYVNDLIEDVEGKVKEQISQDKIASLIKPGQKVCVAVGSRCIDRINVIVKTVIDELKARGAEPFIVTAMGSHGGGTPEGCLQIAADFGITEETMGVPIKADMDVVHLGNLASNDLPIYWDKNAYEADMTVLINRVKPHTEFCGDIESGICKIAAIGLGRHVGCSSLHEANTANFDKILPETAQLIFDKANVGFAIALVENAFDKVKVLEALTKDEILTREPELLKISRASMPSIGVDDIDVLVMEEIGKDISGFGMDTNIVGRIPAKANAPGIPKIGRLIVLRLSELSHGNACGIGLADLTTKEVYDNIDFVSTYANSIACGGSIGAWTEFIPLVMTDEKEAIIVAIKQLGIQDPLKTRIVKIKNTLKLTEIEVSDNLREYIESKPERFTIL